MRACACTEPARAFCASMNVNFHRTRQRTQRRLPRGANMSANREVSQPESEQLRQGLAFLHQAREVPDLEPAQIDHIERRLKGRSHRPRRTLLLPAVAALVLV